MIIIINLSQSFGHTIEFTMVWACIMMCDSGSIPGRKEKRFRCVIKKN